MKITVDGTPEEVAAFWEYTRKVAAEVKTWPAWKCGGVAIAVPEVEVPPESEEHRRQRVAADINKVLKDIEQTSQEE